MCIRDRIPPHLAAAAAADYKITNSFIADKRLNALSFGDDYFLTFFSSRFFLSLTQRNVEKN